MRGKDCCATLGKTPVGITPAYAGKSGAHVSFRTAPLGSPPRMRGKGMTSWGGVLKDRITPAYAGKSPRRGCAYRAAAGSPPRMRGKACVGLVPLCPARITPAYAGKSCPASQGSSSAEDHPRVCGEKFRAYAMIWQEWGSPPRMRGKVTDATISSSTSGITPAYAGKSATATTAPALNWDHPRVCGEKTKKIP